jgi:putative ABC transport system permease protein
MPPRRSPIERVLRAVVRLLPPEFRSDFGDAIHADLADRRASGDRSGLLRRELPSLAAAVAREHASTLARDAKYALRTMRRTPGFTAMAVVMLALGTGVNAAMFSVIDAVMLRSPFTNPGRIAYLRIVENGRPTGAIPPARFAELAAAPGPFSTVAAMWIGPHVLTGRGEPRTIDVECVSASMFDVLGTRPLIGRAFTDAEDHVGAAPVMVLSFDFWHQLGGSPAIVGDALLVNKTPVTVVGIMPRGFAGPHSRSDVTAWLPLRRQIAGGGATGCAPPRSVNVFARLRDGLSFEAINGVLPGINAISLNAQTFYEVRTPFLVLTAAVLCVLLIACFNVGGLQMERALARRREIALRLALGASRGRLVRQMLTENIILALLGACGGFAATWLTLRGIVSLLPGNIPHLDEIEVNPRVLLVAIAVASSAGLISSLFPIGQTRGVMPAADLADGTRSTHHGGGWARRGLVVLEVALSMVVLIGAALMIQTFLTLRPTQPGFDPTRKLTTPVRLQGATPEVSEQFFAQLFERLRVIPAIRGLAGSTYLPMSSSVRIAPLTFDGVTSNVFTGYPTPGYFELLRIPVVAGRSFSADDTSTSTPVLIVNELLAQRISADGRVIGRRIAVGNPARPDDSPVDRLIVGVIANTRSTGADTRPRSEAYVPYAQDRSNFLNVIVETDGLSDAAIAAEIRAAVRTLRPDQVIQPIQPLTAMLERRVERPRFGAWLLGIFAALAVGLAAIGLMTTIGWWVNQRTRELGVRMALGATERQIRRLVFRQGMTLGAAGIAAGCIVAAGLTRYLEGWIYGVTPLDITTFASCALAMLAVAACAVYLPVRRATSVDPVIALRFE